MSDVDGITSSSIIYHFLHRISDCDIYVGFHEGKEHGIDLSNALSYDPDLIIIPDASGTSEDFEKMKNKGIDCIVLDHHNYEAMLNFYDAIVVSSQDDYPNPALSGAGVALKFVKAYATVYKMKIPMLYYSLAACGIVADVMNMTYLENKYIVQTGLKYMVEHPFLMELIKQGHQGENTTPTIKDLGWIVGPAINSVIRLGSMKEKRMVFMSLVNPFMKITSDKRGTEDEETHLYLETARICMNSQKRQQAAIERSLKLWNKTLTLKTKMC